jgi:hypothetical protein
MTEDDRTDGRRSADAGLTPGLQLSRTPLGRTARFVEAVRAAKGEPYVRSWLSGQTCEFEDCVIWTLGASRIRINRECAALIREHRIVVKEKQARPESPQR